jgi:hypothetical protein
MYIPDAVIIDNRQNAGTQGKPVSAPEVNPVTLCNRMRTNHKCL